MTTDDSIVARVGMRFDVDRDAPPPNDLIHDALAAMRAVEVDAPSLELAEFYADTLRRALEQAGNGAYARQRMIPQTSR